MTLNLLPKKYQAYFKDEIGARILYTASMFITVWMVVLGILVFASFQYLQIQNQATSDRIQAAQSVKEISEAEELEAEIIELNRFLFRVDEIRKEQRHDADFILERIAEIVPAGSNLETFTYLASAGMVFLEGHADQRTQVITLQNRLKDDELFEEVEAPLSNLLSAQDIDFSFTLTLSPANTE